MRSQAQLTTLCQWWWKVLIVRAQAWKKERKKKIREWSCFVACCFTQNTPRWFSSRYGIIRMAHKKYFVYWFNFRIQQRTIIVLLVDHFLFSYCWHPSAKVKHFQSPPDQKAHQTRRFFIANCLQRMITPIRDSTIFRTHNTKHTTAVYEGAGFVIDADELNWQRWIKRKRS